MPAGKSVSLQTNRQFPDKTAPIAPRNFLPLGRSLSSQTTRAANFPWKIRAAMRRQNGSLNFTASQQRSTAPGTNRGIQRPHESDRSRPRVDRNLVPARPLLANETEDPNRNFSHPPASKVPVRADPLRPTAAHSPASFNRLPPKRALNQPTRAENRVRLVSRCPWLPIIMATSILSAPRLPYFLGSSSRKGFFRCRVSASLLP